MSKIQEIQQINQKISNGVALTLDEKIYMLQNRTYESADVRKLVGDLADIFYQINNDITIAKRPQLTVDENAVITHKIEVNPNELEKSKPGRKPGRKPKTQTQK